jgi:hypothetical protein
MSNLRIRYTKLGEAFVTKVGRAAFEEQARGEIGEMVVEYGRVLRRLAFHNIEFRGTWFILVPDGDDGVLVDAAVVSQRFEIPDHVRDTVNAHEIKFLWGASFDDEERG